MKYILVILIFTCFTSCASKKNQKQVQLCGQFYPKGTSISYPRLSDSDWPIYSIGILSVKEGKSVYANKSQYFLKLDEDLRDSERVELLDKVELVESSYDYKPICVKAILYSENDKPTLVMKSFTVNKP